MFNVPLDVLAAAGVLGTDPPVQLPIIDPEAGVAAVNCTQVDVLEDLLVTFAVSVIPLAKINVPVPAFETS
jgi:hypothetical protein